MTWDYVWTIITLNREMKCV